MNRRILRLAIPNVISNITVPMLGMIDIAIAGRLGNDAAIGAIAIGAAIFGFIYWNFAFIRFGSSAMTAQARGARNLRESANILVRALSVGAFGGLLLILFRRPLGEAMFLLFRSDADVLRFVREYFFARIWAAPATISIYAIHGWFIGMQNAKAPMWVSIAANFLNVGFSLWFVYGFGLGVAGIAYGTVATQYCSLTLSLAIWVARYGRFRRLIQWRDCFRVGELKRFFGVNRDLFIRGAFNTCVYTFFVAASARFGVTLLAANSIMIQLLTLYTYMADGFAYAAQALTGLFIGAGNQKALRRCMITAFRWSLAIAVLFVLAYLGFWRQILSLFTSSGAIMECVGRYVWWVAMAPLVGYAPFLMDGLMIGATQTHVLRNSMMVSAALFFALFFLLLPRIGNNALWFSYMAFLICRGTTQFFMADRMRLYLRRG